MFYQLRWCFEYSDGKPKKFGMWNLPGEMDSEKAWCQNKDHLLYASVEAKHPVSKEIITMVRCKGSEFVNFGWIAKAVMSLTGSGGKLPSGIIGLQLRGRDRLVDVFVDGSVSEKAHGIDYGQTHLAGFGR